MNYYINYRVLTAKFKEVEIYWCAVLLVCSIAFCQ